MYKNFDKSPKSNLDVQFELLITYGNIIKCKSIISQLDDKDKFSYALIAVEKPYPTFDEYVKGVEFEENELIDCYNSYDEAVMGQKEYSEQNLIVI